MRFTIKISLAGSIDTLHRGAYDCLFKHFDTPPSHGKKNHIPISSNLLDQNLPLTDKHAFSQENVFACACLNP